MRNTNSLRFSSYAWPGIGEGVKEANVYSLTVSDMGELMKSLSPESLRNLLKASGYAFGLVNNF